MKLGLFICVIIWVVAYVATRKIVNHWPDRCKEPIRSLIPEFVAVTGLLAFATVGFFWQILLTPNNWMPAGGGDLAPFLYPNYRFAAEYLKQGIIPLWNPHLYNGMPFAADIQAGLFYPINLVVFLLVPNLTYEWLQYLALFHFWLAGVTMYACLRLLIIPTAPQASPSIHPLAAFAGAIAFQFSDLFIVHFGNLNMIAVAAWLPLVFLLFHHSLGGFSQNQTIFCTPNYGLAAASGVILAIATLAGHIQITLFILLTLGLYSLFYIYTIILNRSSFSILRSSFLKPFLPLLMTLFIMVGLTALLLLPAYEMSQYTRRVELPYTEAAQYSLHPVQMIGLLMPNYFGRDPALHWGPWSRVETGYIGILPLMLAMIGLILSRNHLKWYFAGLALFAMLLALGGYTVVHGWLYAFVPAFNQLRAPARFILLFDFGIAVLAGLGLNLLLHPLNTINHTRLSTLLKPLTWGLGGLMVMALPYAYYATLTTQDRDPSIFNRATAAAEGVVIFSIITTLSLVYLHLRKHYQLKTATHYSQYVVGIGAILLIGFDLFTLGYDVDVGQIDPTAKFHHPEALAYLENDLNLFRIEVTTDVWHLWQPNTAMLHGLYDVWGLYNPLTLADPTLYWSGAPPRSSGRYNFLGIKYIIASKAGAPADGNIVPVFDADPDINIYLNLDGGNRLLFVGQTEIVADHDAAWEAVRQEAFDPTTTVILEKENIGRFRESIDTNEPLALNNQPKATLALLQYDLDRITVGIQTDQAGYLVLADAYYPGWQATINGQPTTLERANFAFRAVYVPAGDHTIQLLFQPFWWQIGLMITAFTILILMVWAIWGWRRSRVSAY